MEKGKLLQEERPRLAKDVIVKDTPAGPLFIEKTTSVSLGRPILSPEVSRLRQNVLLASSATVSFCTPFLFGHPQLMVGTIVNGMLLSASGLSWKKLLPFVMLPSIAVLSRGLLFGPFTPFLVPMVPLIWAGNALFVYTFRAAKTFGGRLSLPFGVVSAAGLKAGFLATTSTLMASAGLLPAVLLPSMGWLQFVTALLGGSLAAGLLSAWARKKLMDAKRKTKFFFMHVEQRE